MDKYVFKKGEFFDDSVNFEMDKKRLEMAADEEYTSFGELENYIIFGRAHIGKNLDEAALVGGIHTLPLTIRRLPVYYERPNGNLLIGHVEAVEKE